MKGESMLVLVFSRGDEMEARVLLKELHTHRVLAHRRREAAVIELDIERHAPTSQMRIVEKISTTFHDMN